MSQSTPPQSAAPASVSASAAVADVPADDLLIRMEKITKRFPGIVANQEVDLRVRQGTFHAVIGENGAGKSTLLNILYGRYRPDGGRIWVAGQEVTNALHSPADAIRRGIGLVSQHYALIPAMTVLENVMLGAENALTGGLLQPRQAETRVRDLAQQLGLNDMEWNQRAERLSVAAQQKVEILKALYRGAKALLLDEPTATLAPQEADALFALLHILSDQGATIVFVTHKLREVMSHSKAVTVLRAGRSVSHFITSETSAEELLQNMIGTRTSVDAATESSSKSPEIKSPIGERKPLLRVGDVSIRNARKALAVQNVTLEVGRGEIVGVAGVDGSGQRELSEAIVGLRRVESGHLFLNDAEITRRDVRQRQQAGLAYIPEDRHRAAMILDFSIAENYLLGHERDRDWGGGSLLHPSALLDRAAHMIARFDVRGASRNGSAPARTLSGGNQQKVVIARAIESKPALLVACQPTRGLDVEATRFVYETLRTARENGLGVLLFSLDLDEILALSDRVAVLFNGRVAGVLPRAAARAETLGALMTGAAHE